MPWEEVRRRDIRRVVLAYCLLTAMVVFSGWATYQDRRNIERHVSSQAERDQARVAELTHRICLEQNRVKMKIGLRPLTICDIDSPYYLKGLP